MIPKQDLLACHDILLEPQFLPEQAAEFAARLLAQNWEQSLHDGDSIDVLVHDVDIVIEHLKTWRAAVLHRYSKNK